MKTILLVGGSHGIGASILKQLCRDHKIINLSRTPPNPHPNVSHYSYDVTKDDLPSFERLEGMVYCPGSIRLKPIKRLSLDEFRQDFELNVMGAVRIIQAYIDILKVNNASVVLFSTVAAKMGMPFHGSTATSKAAVEGLAKSLAAEFATQIRFNVIAPTLTDTPLASQLLSNEKKKEMMKQRHPLKRYLEAQEVARLATYLLSEQSASISGQVLQMDAGLVTVKV